MVMSILVVSCSRENEQVETESDSVESVTKSSNILSELYFDLIKNHFTNPKDFDNLPLITKINLYEYKDDIFLSENTLTGDQTDAVENLIEYVQNLEFEDYDLPNESVIAIYSNFNYEQGTFLLCHLGNSPGDYEPPTQTEGCWWCHRRTITKSCHEVFVDGESIGFYQEETMLRHGIFGIRNSSRDQPGVLMPCDS
jgi:hypothetical protein